MSKKTPFSYTSALEELEQLLNALRTGEVSIDELEPKLKTAREQITACRKNLRSIQTQIETGFSADE